MAIGIYGGTFSPIHYGHINAARSFIEQCGITRLYVVPAAIPPHKRIDYSDNPNVRYEMVKLAFEPDTDITVSDFEIKSAEPSYTVNTLTHFKNLLNEELVFLCGADMFITLDKWRKSEEIFKLAKIAYVDRDNINTADKAEFYRQNYNADIAAIKMPCVDISSTELREMIAENKDVSEYMPLSVMEFIKSHDLFI
jgi:nicotinate (nicotinamide) nucleotide adenylyltransferase